MTYLSRVGPSHRRGATSVIAVATLSLVALVGASLLRLSTLRDRQIREEERRIQADWLAEAGLERTWAQLVADQSYAGEKWDVGSDDLGGFPGRVHIEVVPESDGPSSLRTVHVTAEFPAGDPTASRSSRSFQVRLVPAETGGGM